MIDTENQMVPARRWWAIVLAALGLVVPIGLLVISRIPARVLPGVTEPYAIVPSEAMRVAPRIDIASAQRYPATGHLYFVTVREPGLHTLAWWVGRGEKPVIDGLTEDEKHPPGVTPSEESRQNRELMNGAKDIARYVALKTLGYPVVDGPVVVDELACVEVVGNTCAQTAPADEELDPDDHILAIDGEPITTVADIAPALAGKSPGDVVSVRLDRAGVGEKTVDVPLIVAPGEDEQRVILGIVPFDTSSIDAPVEVAIATNSIGGPSAGLAFTLTLIDELTPGELTGGHDVAVTGTISRDGTVGAIGGLVQKTAAVKQAGAEVFLVPASQSEETLAKARAVAGDDLRIIPVASVDEALATLAELGGNGLDLGQPGAAAASGG